MLDTKRMNTKRESVRGGFGGTGDFLKFDEGETLIYVHPQVYPEDKHELVRGYNFVEVVQHYGGVGGKKAGQVCLDVKQNPILLHPVLAKFLAERKKDPFRVSPKMTCPIEEAIAEGGIRGKKAENQRAQVKWLFGLTPIAFRRSKDEEWKRLKFEPKVLIAGTKLFKGITGEMVDLDSVDITDPEAAVLLKVERQGVDLDTEYEIKADVNSVRKPHQLDKGQRAVLEGAMKPGGPCDLLKVIAGIARSPVALKALLAGVQVVDEGADENEEHRACFGKRWSDDAECSACSDSPACESECKPNVKESPRAATRQMVQADAKTARVPELIAEPRKKAGKPTSLPKSEAKPECWGEHEADDEGCIECNVADGCAEFREVSSGSPESSDPAARPECWGEHEADDEGCEACEMAEECAGSTVEKAAPDDIETDQENVDLDAIQREAEQVAARVRPRKGFPQKGRK